MSTSFAKTPNNVSAKVGPSGYTAGSSTLTLVAGDGAKFPELADGAWLRVTLIRAAVAYSPAADPAEDLTIRKVTAIAGDVLTIEDGTLEGTLDRNYASGDVVECRVTGGELGDIHSAVNAAEATIATNTAAIATNASAISALSAIAVVTTTSYANPSWITSLAGSKISGNISGNAGSITGSITESQVTGLTTDLAAKAPLASPVFTTQITTPIVYGGSTAAADLHLTSTSHATKGNVYLNDTCILTADDILCIGTLTPPTDAKVLVNGSVRIATSSKLFFESVGTNNWIGRDGGTGDTIISTAVGFQFNAGANTFLSIDSLGSVIVGKAAKSTTATDGFLYVPTCAGTPTGTPTAHAGTVPMIVDSSGNKVWYYVGGSWKFTALS
jgi:hypothetical protein